AGADAAFRAVASQAHENDVAVQEAEAYRFMASYQTNGTKALELLKKAEAVLQEKHTLPKATQQQELAVVLRERVSRVLREDNNELADATLKQLHDLADSTHDQVVQIAYDGAAGAVLVAQGKYDEALTHLAEDNRNPISLNLMVRAYQKIGDK